jgi:hypothetical protein
MSTWRAKSFSQRRRFVLSLNYLMSKDLRELLSTTRTENMAQRAEKEKYFAHPLDTSTVFGRFSAGYGA